MTDKDPLHMLLYKSYLCSDKLDCSYRCQQHKLHYHSRYLYTYLWCIPDLNKLKNFLFFAAQPSQVSTQRHWHSSILFPVKTKSGLLHTPFMQQSGLGPSTQQGLASQGESRLINSIMRWVNPAIMANKRIVKHRT